MKPTEMKKQRTAPAGSGYAAVILVAGRSSRMKKFKPLLPLGGKSVIEYLTGSVADAGIDRIVIVTGYGRERLLNAVNGADGLKARGAREGIDIREAYNADYDSGMFSSVKTGLIRAEEAFDGVRGFFVMPADCPLIGSEVFAKLAEAAEAAQRNGNDADTERGELEENGDRFFVPVYEGKKGHPILIPASRVREVTSYDGPGGLKGVTDRQPGDIVRVPVSDEGCVMDMDTLEGYADIAELLARDKKRVPLDEQAAGRLFILIRHGQTRQHGEKMFIGQYDVPLDESGRVQMKKTAGEIIDILRSRGYGALPERIYSARLSRAKESALILKEAFDAESERIAAKAESAGNAAKSGTADRRTEIITTRGLEEINLGRWDGRPIREIREKYSDEYRRRGEDIFTFKTGGAENFYDVQYRAVSALRKILENDSSEVIMIVSHSSVIRALENNLKGLRVDDDWEQVPKGGFVTVDRTEA